MFFLFLWIHVQTRLNKFYIKESKNILMESKQTKVIKRSVFAEKFNTISSKQAQSKKKQLQIADRFILKFCIGSGSFYKSYRAIDLASRKFVTVYIKPFSKQKVFSKNIKEELKQKVFPPVIWSETQKIDKNLFDVEVHAKYGPTLEEITLNYKKKISQSTLYLLLYHFLKIADRLDNSGLVCRNISPKNIIFSDNYLKNDIYFLNSFDIEKKNEENILFYDPKYCSIGTHLKLKSSSKDTVESICYILLDFLMEGKLFQNSENMAQKDYLELKSILKPEGVPKLFVNFFCYVKSLNHNEDVKFAEWKRVFKKQIQNVEDKPYEWITVGNSGLTNTKIKRTPGSKQGTTPEQRSKMEKNSQYSDYLHSSIGEIQDPDHSSEDIQNSQECSALDLDPSIEDINECEESQDVTKKQKCFKWIDCFRVITFSHQEDSKANHE